MSKKNFEIGVSRLDLKSIKNLFELRSKIELSKKTIEKVNHCRKYLDDRLSASNEPIYGVNTGFGSLCNTIVSNSELEQLQYNLVVSHACGMGDEIPKEIVELILLLKIKGLAGGHSGIHLSTLKRLIDFFNYGITPIIYEHGSLGASGDLAPLAHMSLPLIGKGEVYFNHKRTAGHKLDGLFNWKPLKLKAKEGLALLNGTQFMSAYGIYLLLKLERLVKLGDLIAAASMEAFLCRTDFLDPLIHKVRSHKGQIKTAEALRKYLSHSELQQEPRIDIQDPYSFRCIPQVHGASKDTIDNVRAVFEIEINSVTDNPTIFPDEDKIISAGNFHGQPLALNLDYLSIAVAELSSISERRTYKLISGKRNLPAFLTPNPGLNSGFMIPQYTAASIVSQNKQYAHPSSVDTIDSSNGQEDHVSMGANAATKAFKVVQNYEKVLSIELMTAMQALEFRLTKKPSKTIHKLKELYRDEVHFVKQDEELYKLMEKSLIFVQEVNVDQF